MFNFDNTYRQLPSVFYSELPPTPVASPMMVLFNAALADDLGIDDLPSEEADRAALFSGNAMPSGAQPLAQAYAGHQFGHFTMLGDGRAHLIGEHLTPNNQHLDIQLKGSGKTPFSRSGDGRAVLGPMLREYLISEAMHTLGIPTTRALAVVATGETVQRETQLPGAILTRIATSHLRVGTFQFAAATHDKAILQAMLDYTIHRHFPNLIEADNKALALLDAVMHKQADLIVHWMRVGFIHGVMNTDNMSIPGETIDYGPCAFMDTYDPTTVYSSIDHQGRYAFANQPAIAAWNIARLAEALLPLIDENANRAIELAEAKVNTFADLYRLRWLAMMRSKLGLMGEHDDDEELITDLLKWMKQTKADYTNTFRNLSSSEAPHVNAEPQASDNIGPAFTCGAKLDESISAWHTRWLTRLQRNDHTVDTAIALMQQTNPAVIPRNERVEEALASAIEGDLKPFQNLLAVLQSPYEQRDALAPYQSPPGPGACRYQTFCGT